MTKLETRPREEKNSQRRRMTFWLAAAAIIVIAGVALILVNQASEEAPVATNPPPTTIAEVVPTTLAASALDEVPMWAGQGNPGEYQPAVEFVTPFAFTLTEPDWVTGVQSESVFAICSPHFGMNCFERSAVALFALEPGSIEETRALLAGLPDAELGEVEDVTVGGAQGIRFDFSHSVASEVGQGAQSGDPSVPFFRTLDQTIMLGGEQSIVSIVDVDGTIVTIVYQGKTTTDPTAFDEELESGMAIVDSIVWADLS